jgi:hypothetical protein
VRHRFVRREPERKETAGAALVSGVLAAGVGLVTFYFVRLLLARDDIGGGELETRRPNEDGA